MCCRSNYTDQAHCNSPAGFCRANAHAPYRRSLCDLAHKRIPLPVHIVWPGLRRLRGRQGQNGKRLRMSSNALAERVMVAREQASAEREEIQVSQALAPDARPLHVVHPPRTRVAEHDTVPVGALAKRIFDVALASTALIALSPLLASVALWIRLDSPGPALFRQRRGGYRGETFL